MVGIGLAASSIMYLRSSVQTLLSVGSLAAARPGNQPLRFTTNGTFQIATFSDLHFGEAEDLDWGPQQDVNSVKVLNSVLDSEDQQLVVLNGDLITGENTYEANSSYYVDQIVAPMVQRNLPWASTYGNHDSDLNLSRSAILKREQRYTNALTTQMVNTPTSGVSNYYLPVYSADKTNQTPELLLWFFDSRGGNAHQQLRNNTPIPQPNWVDQTVVDWFTATKAHLLRTHNRAIPSLAFVHIPTNAMLAFQQSRPGVSPTREPGINDDNPLAQQGSSTGQGSVPGTTSTYSGQDIPFMRSLLSTPGLLAVFSGHDHGDDWCMRWDSQLPGMNLTGNGLGLCFGRHSGYGGYGSWTRGARQILVSREGLREGRVETWVRLEDGNVSGRVVLNGTYGRDEYGPVAETEDP